MTDKPTHEERHLLLCAINLSEAQLALANLMQRGLPPGSDYAVVRLSCLKAIAACEGRVWVPEGEVK